VGRGRKEEHKHKGGSRKVEEVEGIPESNRSRKEKEEEEMISISLREEEEEQK
jgi:hypothetical protein